jgi:hypothetical protein
VRHRNPWVRHRNPQKRHRFRKARTACEIVPPEPTSVSRLSSATATHKAPPEPIHVFWKGRHRNPRAYHLESMSSDRAELIGSRRAGRSGHDELPAKHLHGGVRPCLRRRVGHAGVLAGPGISNNDDLMNFSSHSQSAFRSAARSRSMAILRA